MMTKEKRKRLEEIFGRETLAEILGEKATDEVTALLKELLTEIQALPANIVAAFAQQDATNATKQRAAANQDEGIFETVFGIGKNTSNKAKQVSYDPKDPGYYDHLRDTIFQGSIVSGQTPVSNAKQVAPTGDPQLAALAAQYQADSIAHGEKQSPPKTLAELLATYGSL